jgi:GNAT superfamily N-acetyltransferase
VAQFAGPAGLSIRIIGPDDAAAFTGNYGNMITAGGVEEGSANPWPVVYEKLADWPHRWLFLAELDGKPVGSASLHSYNKAAWLRGGAVVEEARGHGIQRALIAARAQKALSLGCDLVGSQAEPAGASATNLERMGLRLIGQRSQYKYVPRATR